MLSSKQIAELLEILKNRFESNVLRHRNLDWSDVQNKIEANPEKLVSLHQMEQTGGEPDVVDLGNMNGELLFIDCSPESPSGRRSACYDQEALDSRKHNKPQNSAINMASAMGIDLLDEDLYRKLQSFGEFDLKTSSWIKTPDDIRSRGGALFADRRYNHVFVYHNGAESYYASRGFRGLLRI
jgi:hypothetical protein